MVYCPKTAGKVVNSVNSLKQKTQTSMNSTYLRFFINLFNIPK